MLLTQTQSGEFSSLEGKEPEMEKYYHPDEFNMYLLEFTFADNKDALIELINSQIREVGYDGLQSKLIYIMFYIASFKAVKCATALLEGPLGLKVDLNAVDLVWGMTPLHFSCHRPELIELYLRNGARTDIKCHCKLPLDEILYDISYLLEVPGWSPKNSIYMMFVFLCKLRSNHLKSVRLLFRNTKEVEKEIYRYVKEGKLIEITTLLTVAREEVTSPSLFEGLCDSTSNGSTSLRQLVLSEMASLTASQITLGCTSEEMQKLRSKLETMTDMLRVIEVFERIGDKIELHHRYLTKLSDEELAMQVASLLINAGFAEYKDFEINFQRRHSKRDDRAALVTFRRFHEHFLGLLESELCGRNEGRQLGSTTTKLYEHAADAMWMPKLSNQPRGSYKKQVNCALVTFRSFHQHFLELLERKLCGENEGKQLGSGTTKLYEHVVDAMAIPRLNHKDDARRNLPLNVALEKLRHHPYLNDWTPKKSTFKLVCILCLPQLKETLESIRLVASKTEDVEAICCELVREGKLIELASLLMVAREKLNLTKPMGSDAGKIIRQCILSDIETVLDAEVRLMGRSNSHKLVEKYKNEKEMKLSSLLLLEVFESAGKSIDRYLQSNQYSEGRSLQIAKEIQFLLKKAGFVLKQNDTDLNDIMNGISNELDQEHSGNLSKSVPRDGSLPWALQHRDFSVPEHVSGTLWGYWKTPSAHVPAARLRPFHTMTQKNSTTFSFQVSAPTENKPGIPKVSGNRVGWFLSLGVAVTRGIKRL